jgi:hypothetical protein
LELDYQHPEPGGAFMSLGELYIAHRGFKASQKMIIEERLKAYLQNFYSLMVKQPGILKED